MVLTERSQADIPDDNYVAVALGEAGLKIMGGILAKPGEEVRVGVGDPPGSAADALAFEIFTYGEQYLPDGPLDARPVYRVPRGAREFLKVGIGLQRLRFFSLADSYAGIFGLER